MTLLICLPLAIRRCGRVDGICVECSARVSEFRVQILLYKSKPQGSRCAAVRVLDKVWRS